MKVTLIVLAHLALAYGADPFACPRPDYWGDCICDPTEQSLICSNSPDEIKFWPDKDASWSPFKLIVLDGFKIEAEIKLSDNTKLKSTGLKLTNSLVKDFGSIATILKDVTSVVLDNVLTEDSKQIKLSDLTDKLTVVKLTTFEVTNSQLDDTQMPDVSTWAELQILSLNGNKFTKLNDKIKGLKKLTTEPFESLDNNLYKINLPNNNITCTYDDCDWAFHLKDPAPVPYEHLLNVECVNNHKQLFNLREQDLPGFPTPAPPTPSTPSPPPTTPHSTPEPPTPKPSDVEVKVGNQWLEIKRELWPYVDSEDSIHNTPTDFFIIHPGDINFKSITKDVLPGSENVKFPVKLSFKYWAHEAIATTYIEKNKKDTIIDKISKEYINFDSYWLYREYILTELQLKSYDFWTALDQYSVIALKDIKIDSPKDNDVCFELKYLLIKSKITPATIDIHYNVDPTEFAAEKNKIFTFTPMVKLTTTDKDIETYAFCLRDVLALSAENLLITFVANTGGADGDDTLALSIDYKPKAKDPWKFTSNKFIQTFNDKERKPVTEIPTTAHLMGPWIQYNSNLGNGLNEYSVTVKQEKVFNAFTIRPKICTDLSQCFDVNAIGVKADSSVSEILKCDKTGTNFGYKSNPTMDNPNHCICNDGYYGAKCDQLAKPIEVKVEPPKKGDWGEQASPKVGFYPTKKGPLIFNFKDINADMFDICPTIEYTVTEPKALMKLTVQYSEGSASPDTPVDTSTYIDEVLKKTPEKGNAFTFCVSDLRNKPQKTFSVVITAEATATKPEDQIYDATTLTITKFSATKIPINRPNFIQNVDIKHKQYWTEQKWHTMSVENNFIPSKDKTSHQLKVMVKAKAQPISVMLKPETNKQIPTQFVEIAYDKKLKTFTDQEIAADIPNTAQQIKLFLKFTFTADTNKDTNFDVTINSLSEHAHLQTMNGFINATAKMPKKLCNSYPIIPDFNAKNPLDRPNCEIIHTETPPKDTETCICPQTQFKSITGKAGCESKKNYKYNNEKPCKKDGSNIKCDIFTATDQQWYDTYQVSHADKYFPLYSPTKVADELSIEFSNLRAEEDVCFTLNYYSSGTSTITVTSAEPKSVGLLLNSLVDIPQWNQQYICGSYLTHAYTAAKAVKINIKGSDIHAGINIGPVLAIRNTFIDEPVLSHYNNKVIETAIKTEWPIVIGLKDNWIYDEKNNDNVKFAIKATEKPSETKYTTYLMSKWIAASGEHSLLRLQLDPKKEMKGFTIEFVVFDQNMQEVADPNRLVYGDKTFDTKTIIDTIDGDGAIEVQLPAKNQKVIRVGMKVVYKEDKTAKPLFTVSKISVNDPCITVDKYKIIPNLCGEYSSDKLCYPLTKATFLLKPPLDEPAI
ncbi:unnamed protein product [Medioppia subpectinata]|uniref:EGF-like domain-containing protein n=1 Tax=Medioppia subpectinata TaxID=1979941 RepID=A0A7R9KSK3_9ACAR|nr:unnamed protein product [Medioppia subpectinata]CAG2107860.1 unnamed protein product [Medioppia subpectinata]